MNGNCSELGIIGYSAKYYIEIRQCSIQSSCPFTDTIMLFTSV